MNKKKRGGRDRHRQRRGNNYIDSDEESTMDPSLIDVDEVRSPELFFIVYTRVQLYFYIAVVGTTAISIKYAKDRTVCERGSM